MLKYVLTAVQLARKEQIAGEIKFKKQKKAMLLKTYSILCAVYRHIIIGVLLTLHNKDFQKMRRKQNNIFSGKKPATAVTGRLVAHSGHRCGHLLPVPA